MKSAGNAAMVQSVDRALLMLEWLSEQGALSVTEIAEKLGTHKSTASRLLATLEQHGLVEQERNRGKYRLGIRLVHLASSVRADLELVSLARPICRRLSEATQETVNLAVLDEDEVLSIDQVIGSASIVSMNWLGQRHPLSCTSTGKVLLAFMPSHEQYRLIRKPLIRCTPNSVLKFEVLEKQLKEICEHGYGYTLEELELGLNALAAPIYNLTGEVIASLCISGPSYRLSEERMHELGELVKKAGLEVSERLGYRLEPC